MWEYSMSLYHHGIPGMHWGKRRYQYEDGTYTPEGRLRYFGPQRSYDPRHEREHINSLDFYNRGKRLRSAGADKNGRTEVIRARRIANGYRTAGAIGGISALVGAYSLSKQSTKMINATDKIASARNHLKMNSRFVSNSKKIDSIIALNNRKANVSIRSSKLKKRILIGGAVLAAGMATYGAYKAHSINKQGEENAMAIQEYERRRK